MKNDQSTVNSQQSTVGRAQELMDSQATDYRLLITVSSQQSTFGRAQELMDSQATDYRLPATGYLFSQQDYWLN